MEDYGFYLSDEIPLRCCCYQMLLKTTDQKPVLGKIDFLEKEMATHSSILAWRIPGGLQSMGSQRVRYD